MILYRRRLGISQTQMAALLGIHRETYGRLERGKKVQVEIEQPSLGELSKEEFCFLVRRRSGKTQEECADAMGITRYWFNLMELGKAPSGPLEEYWGNYEG